MIEDIDRDNWGDGYKTAFKSTMCNVPTARLTLESMVDIKNLLFPAPPSQRIGANIEEPVIDCNNHVIILSVITKL